MNKTLNNVSKVFALVLALVMVMAVMVPAFATDVDSADQTNQDADPVIVKFVINFRYGHNNAPNDKWMNRDELESINLTGPIVDGPINLNNTQIPANGRVEFEVNMTDAAAGDQVELNYTTAGGEQEPITLVQILNDNEVKFLDVVEDKVVVIAELVDDTYEWTAEFDASDVDNRYFAAKGNDGDGIPGVEFAISRVQNSVDSHTKRTYQEDAKGNPVPADLIVKTGASSRNGFSDFAQFITTGELQAGHLVLVEGEYPAIKMFDLAGEEAGEYETLVEDTLADLNANKADGRLDYTEAEAIAYLKQFVGSEIALVNDDVNDDVNGELVLPGELLAVYTGIGPEGELAPVDTTDGRENTSTSQEAVENAGYIYTNNPQYFNIWDVEYDRLSGDFTGSRTIETRPNTIAKVRDFAQVENLFMFAEQTSDILVKIFTNGDPDNASVRRPVVGATVALYENDTEIGDRLKAGKEVAKGVTGETGIVEFLNVPNSVIEQIYLPPVSGAPAALNEIDGFTENGFVSNLNQKVQFVPNVYSLPNNYLIKQLDAGDNEGIAPYPYYISMEGFYEKNDGAYQGNSGNNNVDNPRTLTFTKNNAGQFVIEIENYGDFIYNTGGRLAGADRFATAVEIAEAQFPNGLPKSEDGYKNVVVAEVGTFADALTAGTVAFEYEAPLLFVKGNELPAVTAEYIKDEEATRVILVGGPNTISPATEKAIKDLGVTTKRISGENRFGTAVAAGEALRGLYAPNKGDQAFYKGYNTKSTVFIANGYNFVDALTASVPSAYYGIPMLLTQDGKLPAETLAALKDWDIETVILVGGEKSISEAVRATLVSTGNDFTVERISGDNRQTTSMKIAEEFFTTPLNLDRVLFADLDSFADALAAAPYGARIGSPVILVDGDKLPISDVVKDFIEDNNIGHATIVGGTAQITKEVRDALNELLTVDTAELDVIGR